MDASAERSRSHRAMETSATVAFVVYALLFGWRLVDAVEGSASVAVLAGGIVAGYLVADLVSGLAHWVGDRFFDETTPLVGQNFIAPFRRHHVAPREMVEHGLVELVGNTAILALPPMALAHHSLRPDSLPLLFSGGLLLSSLAGAVCTNLIHRWAHMPRPPGPARWLQGRGLILSPERHARHHRRPFDRAYCTTTGWLNAPMDRLGVWKAVERWLGRAARQDPR